MNRLADAINRLADDIVAKFPKGETVDVAQYLRDHGNPEAADKWEEMNEEYGDQFKEAADGRMLDYGDTKSDSGEGEDIKKNLDRLTDLASALEQILQDQDDLPQWVHEKIATALDRVQSVYNYLSNKIDRIEGDVMAATKGDGKEYQEYFKKKMKEHGLDGVEGVDDKKLKKFFEDVDRGWTSDKEASETSFGDVVAAKLDDLAARIRAASKE